MQQAARVSHYTAFFTAEVDGRAYATAGSSSSTTPAGIFTNPGDKRTEDYITGRFG